MQMTSNAFQAGGQELADTMRISPSAHYTSHVWVRNGMSYDFFDTPLGNVLYALLFPLNTAASLTCGGLTLERIMLQRHRVIDHLLEKAIDQGVRQVLELGSGLSPRGLRVARKYHAKGVRYVEADLPSMAERKRRLVSSGRLTSDYHTVVEADILAERGALSIGEVANRYLKAGEPAVVVTEGLLGYFDPDTVFAIWQRISAVVGRAGGVYLSDLHLESETPSNAFVRFYKNTLEQVTRGRTHALLRDADEARERLLGAGFLQAVLHRPADLKHAVDVPVLRRADVLRVVEARC